eukprot:12416194-Heterocapsa_arctica.AAC.1
MARAWQEHGKSMARAWHKHGNYDYCSCHALAMFLPSSTAVLPFKIKWVALRRSNNSFDMHPSAHQVQLPTPAAPVEGLSERLPLSPSELVAALGNAGWGEEGRTAFAQARPPGSPSRRARGRSSTLFRPQA